MSDITGSLSIMSPVSNQEDNSHFIEVLPVPGESDQLLLLVSLRDITAVIVWCPQSVLSVDSLALSSLRPAGQQSVSTPPSPLYCEVTSVSVSPSP